MSNDHDSKLKSTGFFGWRIVFYGFMLMAISFSIIMSCHSLFVLPVTQDLGFARGQFTLTFTLVGLSAAASSAWVGRILSRSRNLKLSLSLFVLLAGLGFASFSLARAPWQFYLLALVIGPGFVGSSNLAGSLLVNQWFIDRRGFALGIVAAGSGIGTALLSPVISNVILSWGWQAGYLFSGFMILLICLPLTWRLAIRSPGEVGLEPLTTSTSPTSGAAYLGPDTGLSLSEVKKMPSFWLFFLTMFLLCVIIGGSQLTIVAYMLDLGHSAGFSALMFSIQALGMLFGKLSLGYIFDRLGPRRGILVAICGLSLSMIGYLNSTSMVIAVIASVIIGMSASLSTVGNAYLTGSFFGSRDFGNIYGLVNVTMMTGATTGPLVTSLIFDRTGSYTFAWIGFLALIAICGVSLLWLQTKFFHLLTKRAA
jgi:MFS family permease